MLMYRAPVGRAAADLAPPEQRPVPGARHVEGPGHVAGVRTAAAVERPLALISWTLLFLLVRSFVTGWLLASWVCLYRQCEIGRVNRETWIRY